MNSTLQDSLHKLREARTDLESYRAELRQELDQIEQVLEGINSLLANTNGSSQRPATTVNTSDPRPPQETASTSNGSSRGALSRRQAILQILPEFGGHTFAPRDVREKYVQRFPEEDNQNLPPTISSLLRNMAEKDEIERVGKEGDKSTDAFIYRVKESNRETLLSP